MPFLNLNNNWSNLAQYYNNPSSFKNTSKPEVPRIKYTAFDDGLIRGGVVNATLSSVRDTARIGKFLASGKGVLFIAKQVGLQLSNPLLEQPQQSNPLPTSGQGFLNNVANTVVNFISKRSPNQIYNLGLNTITQVPLMAFGGHIIRQGLLPIGGGGYLNGSTDNIKGYNYEKITKANNILASNRINSTASTQSQPNIPAPTTNMVGQGETGKVIYNQGGKLITQYTSNAELKANLGENSKTVGFSAGNATVNQNINVESKTNKVDIYRKSGNRLLNHLGAIAKFGKQSSTVELISYNGGPDSTYGIGKTTIKTYPDQQTDITKKIPDQSTPNNSNTPNSVNDDYPKSEAEKLLNGFKAPSYNTLIAVPANITRFKAPYIKPKIPPGFGGENIEDRIGVSKIGKNSDLRSVDSINTISIMDSNTFYASSSKATISNSDVSTLFTYTAESTEKVQSGYFGRDIIKFRIEFLNNNTNIPEVLAFRAYIDDFQDGMQAKWNGYRYMGRGEDFYIYDGFTRDMSVSFTIHAHSPAEMAPIYQKLNYLMSAFAPDYSSANKMRGNIGYLTVGDYVYKQPGVFTDIKLSGMLDTHWEIALNDPEGGSDSNQYEVPKHIKVSLSFKPIHNFLPRRSSLGKEGTPLDKSPFITPNSALIGKGELKNKYLYNPAVESKPANSSTTTAATPTTTTPSS